TGHLWKNGEVFRVDPEQDYVNDLFARAALDFIRSGRDRPFFLYLAFPVPHAELRAPEAAVAVYRGKFPEAPFANARADAVASIDPSPMRQASIGYRSQPTPRAAFAAMITRMDRHVGDLLALLKELKLDENTVVLFTSDNGPHKEGGADPTYFRSSGPLRGIKRDLYEGGIRVPMIVRWPGKVKPGTVSAQVWAHWDFLPTAAELAGAPAPPGLDGISMVPALLGKRQRNHEFLYWEFHERVFDQAVRMGDWKAVRHELGGPLELYNLKTDLREERDVAAAHPEVVARIEDYLKTARTESEQWPVKKR
ncbi:MAG TPA: sulfatase-like hydrolase/transferase, partial [Blastocatellia bacterium]|nr:sulfatase-like hydrolase/transferase [Blastocatellia bacterium]